MFKNKFNILFFLLIFPFLGNAQTTKYPNSVIKEVGYTKGKLVSTERKLFDKRGRLNEIHFFNGNNVGKIKSYYNDTTIASVIEVVQSIKDKKYTLTVPAGSEIYGFYKGTDKKKYDIIVKNEFDIDYELSYKRYNVIFNDFVLLYKRRRLKGIEGSKITYYTRFGIQQASAIIGSPDVGNLYRSLHDNKQVESEGHLRKVRSSDFYVGEWLFYSTNGVILKEETYYNGETSETHIKYGTRIGEAIYRYKSGKTKAVVLFPQLEDINHRTDTLVTYYDDSSEKNKKDKEGQLRSKYDEDKKAVIRTRRGDKKFEFSGLYEEFYENGERKIRGFLCKSPRRAVDFLEIQQDQNLKCISYPTNNTELFQKDKTIKQIGMWYYFDDKGNITDMKEYRLCGQLREKSQLSKKKIEKESSKYKMRKNSYQFQYIINDNE